MIPTKNNKKASAGIWLWATVAVFGLAMFYMVLAEPVITVYNAINGSIDDAGADATVQKIYFTWRFWPLVFLGAVVIIALMASIRRDTRSEEVF